MHIVILTRVLPHHSVGGMQTVAWDLARTFVLQGCRVTIITTEVPGRAPQFVDEGVFIEAIPGTSWKKYGARWWRRSRDVFKAELVEHCDIVLSVSAAGFGLLPLRVDYPNIPFVMQAHGTSFGEVRSKWRTHSPKAILGSLRNLGWIAKDLVSYRHFDAIAVVGGTVWSDFLSRPIRWAVPGSHVHLILNGIDTDLFRPDAEARRRMRADMGWQDETCVVVSCCRLHRQKGIHLGLDAFAALQKKHSGDVRYLIVGDGPERAALEKQVRKLKLVDKVYFTGSVRREIIPGYLQAADAMLFTTTHSEGLPLNVLEAISVGLPTIVSDHLFRGLPLRDYVCAVPPSDPIAISTALELALSRTDLSQEMLPPEYSLQGCASSYLSLFEQLSHDGLSAVGGTSLHA